MNEKRVKIEKEIESSIVGHDERGAGLIPEYINEISKDISMAIGSVNPLSAPFLIALLEVYAETIKLEYPDIDKLVAEIKTRPMYQCKAVLPRG